MVMVSKTTAALCGILNLALIIQISSGENAFKVCTRFLNVQTTTVPTSSDEDYDFDKTNPYLKKNSNPDPCSNTNLTDILKCVRTYQRDLADLKSSSSSNEDTKFKICLFEISLENHYRQELDLKRICPQNAFNTDKTSLQSKPMNGISQSIVSGEFASADKQLDLSSGDYILYDTIVKGVYEYPDFNANRTLNFHKLLNFTQFTQNTEHRFKVYDALYRTMRSHKDTNISNLLLLHYYLMVKMVTVPGIYGLRGIELVCKLWGENREKAITVLSAALMDDAQWPTALETKSDIQMFCEEFVYDVTAEVIDKVYNRTDLQKLLEKIDRNVDNIQERIIAYESIINKLEVNDKLNGNGIIPMIQRMKMAWDDLELYNVNVFWRKRYKTAIEKLPSSIRNVILFSPICIKNSRYGEYLYAEESGYRLNDRKYREVFAKMPKGENKTAEFKWKVRLESNYLIEFDNVKVKGNLNINDSSCARSSCSAVTVSSERAYEYKTWRWRLRVGGKGVQMNMFRPWIYLRVDDRKRDNDKRFVFTSWSKVLPLDQLEYVTWEFVDCSEH